MGHGDKGIFVPDFMMGEGLHLTGINLLLLAYIYDLWQAGKDMYASCSTIARRLGCSREAVNRSLIDLKSFNYIICLPQNGKRGNHYYTINSEALEAKQPEGCDETAQVRCDETAQVGVMIPHIEVCENRTGTCDQKSHNSISNNTDNIIEDNTPRGGSPLPLNCSNDEECRRLWSLIIQSKKWSDRSPGALAQATKVLADEPVEVCRLMLAHTVEGDYPRIYEPTDEMKQKAKLTSPRCAEKSHHLSLKEVTDDVVFRKLYPFFPKELMEKIFVGKSAGERGLRFTQNEGRVAIYCAPEVKTWLETIPETLNPILGTWVGQTYSGYDLIDTIN